MMSDGEEAPMCSRNRLVLTAMLMVCFAASPSVATQIHVPEDYPTFRQGLEATAPGETLRVGPGVYTEPGGPAWVNPGVTVIGSGWHFIDGTALVEIELFFVAGSDSAIVQDLKINHATVSSDNSLGVVRRCLFGSGFADPYESGYLAFVRGGLIIEECFINCDLFYEPRVYFHIEGGSFVMRNCVVAIISTFLMMDVHDIGPYPIESVDVQDNTFFAESEMSFFIDGSTPIPGPINFVNNIFQTAPDRLRFTCSSGSSIAREYNVFSSEPAGLCGLPSKTNIVANPLLCDPHYDWPDPASLDDFELHEESPCIGAGINGTTIGALGVGCGPTTAIEENPVPSLQELRIDVSPNPLVRGARLVIGSEYAGATLLRLYDASGRLEVGLVLQVPFSGAALDLDRELGTMSRGVHFLEVTQGHRREVRKLVVVP